MNQRTHTWIAIRAIALLEDGQGPKGLVKILKSSVKGAAIGSWIPDMADSKVGSGDIDNHVLKMKPYGGPGKSRFVKKKNDLLRDLGPHRQVCGFLDQRGQGLGSAWWNKAYKADPSPGQHLANRTMALSTTLIDLMILGDKKVAALVPGRIRFAKNLDKNARSRMEEVATYCFMLSHFAADACQPCHCDARNLYGYSKGVHKEMEAHWSRILGTYFDKKKYLKTQDTPETILNRARAIDDKFGLDFSREIPDLKARDPWLEIMNVCRASFAVASILVGPELIPYESDRTTTFEEVFKGEDSDPGLLADLDAMALHDAVLNTAVVWKSIWNVFD